jgi:hypothetical protein
VKKPFASDWITINDEGPQYSPTLDRYWFQGRVYDERSAQHNGLIGAGALLRQITKQTNRR